MIELTISSKRRIRQCLKRCLLQAEEHFLHITGVGMYRWKVFVMAARQEAQAKEQQMAALRRRMKLVDLLKKAPPGERTDAEVAQIMELLTVLRVPPAASLSSDETALRALAAVARLRSVQEFEILYFQGDSKPHPVYAVLGGEVHLVRLPMVVGKRPQDRQVVTRQLAEMDPAEREFMLGPPDEICQKNTLFGERLLLQGGASARELQTALCPMPTELLEVPRAVYRQHCVTEDLRARTFLSSVALCQGWSEAEMGALAEALTPRAFPARAPIQSVGQPLQHIYLLERGDVTVAGELEIRPGGPKRYVELAHLSSGGFIGDMELGRQRECYAYHYLANVDCRTYALPVEAYLHHFAAKERVLELVEDSIISREALYARKIERKLERYRQRRRSTELNEKLDILKYGTQGLYHELATVDALPPLVAVASRDRSRRLRRAHSEFLRQPSSKIHGVGGGDSDDDDGGGVGGVGAQRGSRRSTTRGTAAFLAPVEGGGASGARGSLSPSRASRSPSRAGGGGTPHLPAHLRRSVASGGGVGAGPGAAATAGAASAQKLPVHLRRSVAGGHQPSPQKAAVRRSRQSLSRSDTWSGASSPADAPTPRRSRDTSTAEERGAAAAAAAHLVAGPAAAAGVAAAAGAAAAAAGAEEDPPLLRPRTPSERAAAAAQATQRLSALSSSKRDTKNLSGEISQWLDDEHHDKAEMSHDNVIKLPEVINA